MKNLTKILVSIYVAIMMFAVACKKDEPTPTPPVTTPTTTTPVVKSTAKDISKFSFAALSPVVDATIDASTKAITTTVPAGTDVTKLVPTITISDKSTVSPATGVAQDFSKEVSYTVTAEDGGMAVYKVKIDIALFVADKKLYGYDAETGVKKWEFTSSSSIYTPPTVVNGLAYVIAGNSILGIDVKTGLEKWNYYFGYITSGDPLTIVDNVLYFVSNSYSSPYTSRVGAIDINTKKELWVFTAPGGGTKQNSIGAAPVVANGIVCFSTYDYNWYALDTKTGSTKWQFAEKSYSYTNSAVINGIIYIGGSDAIYAKDILTGTTKWAVSDVYARGITVSDGLLYAATSKSSDKTYAVSAYDISTGASKWEYKLTSQSSALSAVFKGTIYFTGDTGDKIFALDSKTGVKKWDAAGDYAIPGPTVANGLVYFPANASKNKKIVAMNSKTGALKWEFITNSGSNTACAIIDKNGVVYYPSSSGMVQ
jgi:eukaryotic-like serine/threonine-protein kinase